METMTIRKQPRPQLKLILMEGRGPILTNIIELNKDVDNYLNYELPRIVGNEQECNAIRERILEFAKSFSDCAFLAVSAIDNAIAYCAKRNKF